MSGNSLGFTHVVRPPRGGGPGPHPVLVLLHGRGADEQDLLGLADELDPRLYVVSARAPLTMGPGFAWYHLVDIGNPDLASFKTSLSGLTRFVEALPSTYPIDGSRIYLLGFSQGAMMAGSLLLVRPSLPAGTVMLSGYLPLNAGLAVEPAGLVGRPVFVGHGTVDPVIPIEAARQARDYLTRAGTALTYREYPIPHYIAPNELSDVSSWLTDALGSA
jgi:phospholipase/carboxylesterase